MRSMPTRSSTGAKSIVKEDWVKVGPALSSLSLSRTFPGVNPDKFVVLHRDALRGQWKLNCRRANFASRAVSKQKRCVSCWSVCSDDRTAHRDKHLDRRRIHGSAAWFYRAEWHGTDDTSGESVFWSRVCFPRSAG